MNFRGYNSVHSINTMKNVSFSNIPTVGLSSLLTDSRIPHGDAIFYAFISYKSFLLISYMTTKVNSFWSGSL